MEGVPVPTSPFLPEAARGYAVSELERLQSFGDSLMARADGTLPEYRVPFYTVLDRRQDFEISCIILANWAVEGVDNHASHTYR
jgi:hypothetical protein